MRHEPTLPIKLDSTGIEARRLDPQPSFATYGPRDAVEWRWFLAIHGVGPG